MRISIPVYTKDIVVELHSEFQSTSQCSAYEKHACMLPMPEKQYISKLHTTIQQSLREKILENISQNS